MPINFTKNGVDSSFLGSEKLFTKGGEKIQHATKEHFFKKNYKKKTLKFFGSLHSKFFKGVQNQKKNNEWFIFVIGW